MRTRDAVIEYQKTLDDVGTLTKDLDLVDPVSAIFLEFEARNGTTSNEDNFLSDVITKVEIVDGSQVLYSLNQSQLEALYFYKTGKTPTLFPSEKITVGSTYAIQRNALLLLFGRYLWDPDFSMDFTKFKNPQLKITSNLAAINAVGATGFVTATLKATIIAKVMENGKKPAQYLMAKEIESFTSATSGEKRIDLPTDYIYRMLMGRFWVEGSDIDEVITDFKMTCDSDKFIPFNRKVKQLDAEALTQFGLCELKHDIYRAHGATVRLLVNKEPVCLIMDNTGTADIPCINWQWSSNFYLSLFTHAGANDTTARDLTVREFGHALHATLPVPFGIMDDPTSWFDPKPYKKVELVLTQAVAATCQICLEQVRPL